MSYKDFIKKIKDWSCEIDVYDTEQSNMLFQINHDNGTDFTLDEIELSLPVKTKVLVIPLDHPNNPIELNTKVVVGAKKGAKYRGSDSYYYRRIDIKVQWEVLHGNLPFVLPNHVNTDDEIKDYLFTKMPFRKDSIKVYKVSNPTGKDYIELVPIKDSYLYVGRLVIPLEDTTKDDGPMAKIRQMGDMQGLNYMVNKILTLEGLNYITHHRLELQGLNYKSN